MKPMGTSTLGLYTFFLTLPLDMFHWSTRDGDNILAVVRSTDVKHDGRSQGLVAPNVEAQIAMQISHLEKANLAQAEIEYVAFTFTTTRVIVYLLLVSSKLTALICIYLSSSRLMLILR